MGSVKLVGILNLEGWLLTNVTVSAVAVSLLRTTVA